MSGIFSGKGVMRSINKFLPDKNIEDFKRTFACVSCELYSQQEVVFTSGNVREAVRASLSIPGIFVPVEKDDKLYVDGGMINNLPEDVAVKLGADIIYGHLPPKDGIGLALYNRMIRAAAHTIKKL